MPKHNAVVEPRIAATGSTVDDWLRENYYADGCNLRTAAAKLELRDKRTLWAFLQRTGRQIKPQAEAQSASLNPFAGRAHQPETRALIGAASRARQPVLPRNETMQFGHGAPMRGRASPLFKDGIKGYRREALENFGCTCFQCGKSATGRRIDVHHRDGNRSNNELANLVVLCRSCHLSVHRGEAHDRRNRSRARS